MTDLSPGAISILKKMQEHPNSPMIRMGKRWKLAEKWMGAVSVSYPAKEMKPLFEADLVAAVNRHARLTEAGSAWKENDDVARSRSTEDQRVDDPGDRRTEEAASVVGGDTPNDPSPVEDADGARRGAIEGAPPPEREASGEVVTILQPIHDLLTEWKASPFRDSCSHVSALERALLITDQNEKQQNDRNVAEVKKIKLAVDILLMKEIEAEEKMKLGSGS